MLSAHHLIKSESAQNARKKTKTAHGTVHHCSWNTKLQRFWQEVQHATAPRIPCRCHNLWQSSWWSDKWIYKSEKKPSGYEPLVYYRIHSRCRFASGSSFFSLGHFSLLFDTFRSKNLYFAQFWQLKFAICTVHRLFHGFSRFSMVFIDFPNVFIDLS